MLDRVESRSLLLPDVIDTFKQCKYSEGLAGFYVSSTPLYTLGCLLGEQWAVEDVLNMRAELTYFHRATRFDLGTDPSFLFLPTSFINDCRTLYKLPNRPPSSNIIDLRARIRSGSVQTIGFVSYARSHYSGVNLVHLHELEHGDSLHLRIMPDLIPVLQWAFMDLHGFTPAGGVRTGLVDRQKTVAGGGSCGIAATNFVEHRAGLGIPRWHAAQSAQFRDKFLRDIILYHVIARAKPTVGLLHSTRSLILMLPQSFLDWVYPCRLVANGEVPVFTANVGYRDFNLYNVSWEVRRILPL
ncbi:hypothetical protein C8R46DRAFT_901901 [Mycena filopes]|nr:hypothetical protein C8R46DRAFT_901901 [Mycena filopes]